MKFFSKWFYFQLCILSKIGKSEKTQRTQQSLGYLGVNCEFEIGEMAPPSAANSFPDSHGRLKYTGLLANAKKHKSGFVQFFIMTGILLTSLRSLGQKYRIHELTEDAVALTQEQESITARMNHIKQSLRAEAAAEPTGAFAARLRLLFGDEWCTNPSKVPSFTRASYVWSFQVEWIKKTWGWNLWS